jgi:hypothetical protein
MVSVPTKDWKVYRGDTPTPYISLETACATGITKMTAPVLVTPVVLEKSSRRRCHPADAVEAHLL